MKLDFNRHNLHAIVMILCFVYGGISLSFFLMQIGPHFISPGGGPAFVVGEIDVLFNESCKEPGNCTIPLPSMGVERFQRNISGLFNLILFVSLSGSVISILAGTSLWILLRKKERKKLTDDIVNTMTTDDEKLVMRVLEENSGELTQSELARRTKLSKVKVHRMIKRLESIGIVSKYSYGMTNKIKLNNAIHKEKTG
jgi:ribosomal protein S25